MVVVVAVAATSSQWRGLWGNRALAYHITVLRGVPPDTGLCEGSQQAPFFSGKSPASLGEIMRNQRKSQTLIAKGEWHYLIVDVPGQFQKVRPFWKNELPYLSVCHFFSFTMKQSKRSEALHFLCLFNHSYGKSPFLMGKSTINVNSLPFLVLLGQFKLRLPALAPFFVASSRSQSRNSAATATMAPSSRYL